MKEQRKEIQRDLSGGQWQKLGLARAFMRGNEADLMVLDEPTVNLDPEAEFKLFETINLIVLILLNWRIRSWLWIMGMSRSLGRMTS